MDANSELLTQDEAAELLRVKASRLQWLRDHREGPPFVRISDRVLRYRRRDLDAWLEERASLSYTEARTA